MGQHNVNLPQMNCVRRSKGASSHFLNKESGLNETLYWQDGYGVVSVRKREIPAISDYIRRQKEHHRVGTLIEELERAEAEE